LAAWKKAHLIGQYNYDHMTRLNNSSGEYSLTL